MQFERLPASALMILLPSYHDYKNFVLRLLEQRKTPVTTNNNSTCSHSISEVEVQRNTYITYRAENRVYSAS